ncbi:hypothetical protein PAPYR_1990 [Paratrimastix pyriformis]|uniref:Uncharacterized protein n=1 Tax=Paratrimastix pyriformis TaxID=342808 RepID=A0ABQ8URF2_9EUKA|nr:hypothetical protein PAPYR_1990 [Paratrimastix pyriformis]
MWADEERHRSASSDHPPDPEANRTSNRSSKRTSLHVCPASGQTAQSCAIATIFLGRPGKRERNDHKWGTGVAPNSWVRIQAATPLDWRQGAFATKQVHEPEGHCAP